MFPTIAEYNQAIQKFGSKAFNTLTYINFIPSRILPFKIYSYGSGSFAVVFKAEAGGTEYAIRCFISAEQENVNRYRNICKYLNGVNATWVTKIELLENEIDIQGLSYPVIKMDWVEGLLLNTYISKILYYNNLLEDLQNEVLKVSTSLEHYKIGHGDIQCGNIIIAKDEKGKGIIKLIDYDGMFIPLFSDKINLERGRTEFQHPDRINTQYNEKIDRFSFWVIVCALEALKFDKNLWLEVMQGGFNTLDNLLFIGDDFKYFNNSKLVNRLYGLNKPSLNFYLNKLNKFCNSSPSNIEFPQIYNSANNDEYIYEEPILINTDLVVNIITSPSGAAVLNSTFQKIGVTPLTISKQQYLDKSIILAYGTKIKQVDVKEHTKIIEFTFTEQGSSNKGFTQSPSSSSAQKGSYPSGPPISTPNITPSPPESNDGGVIILIVILFVIIFIAVIAGIDRNNSSNTSTLDNSINNNATSYLDTAMKVPLDTASFIPENNKQNIGPTNTLDTTINTSSNQQNSEETLVEYTDMQGNTAQEIVTNFFNYLNNHDCNSAWSITYNPIWEQKGQSWFCSSDAFGSVTKAVIVNTYIKTHTAYEVTITVQYYLEDLNKENLCYNQDITVTKVSYNDNIVRWEITKMKNIVTPYPCDLKD